MCAVSEGITKDAFDSQQEYLEFLVLDTIYKSSLPVGSWVLKSLLESNGITISTASVGRLLKDLDTKGLTVIQGQQGRVITPAGGEFVKEVWTRLQRHQLRDRLVTAAKPIDLKELLDILHARVGLERVAARFAAIRATKEDLVRLREVCQEHHQTVSDGIEPSKPAYDFHQLMARASKNQFIITTLDLLIFEEVNLESRMEHLVTREKGPEYVEHHFQLLQAIERKDAAEAEKLAAEHVEAVIRAIYQQAGIDFIYKSSFPG